MTVGAAQTSGANTVYAITFDPALTEQVASGWTMQVVEADGSADLAKYFDCAVTLKLNTERAGSLLDPTNTANVLDGNGGSPADCEGEVALYEAYNPSDVHRTMTTAHSPSPLQHGGRPP